MKLIAHRGGSYGRENSLETIVRAARAGADAVECDIRKTSDEVLVIYHDPDLKRLTGNDSEVADITFAEMKKIMEDAGHKILTFDELASGYKETTPILLHIKLTGYDEKFAEYVVLSGLPVIAGVMSVDMLRCFSPYLPKERILAFVPDYNAAREFYENGAGIIRLWEQWLARTSPDDIKKLCPDASVYIMAYDPERDPQRVIPLESMDGSIESLEKCKKLGADGILLNNIDLALEWRKNKQ